MAASGSILAHQSLPCSCRGSFSAADILIVSSHGTTANSWSGATYYLCRCCRDILWPPFEQVPSLNQGPYLSVRDRSAEHPEPAIRVHVLDPAGPHGFFRLLD